MGVVQLLLGRPHLVAEAGDPPLELTDHLAPPGLLGSQPRDLVTLAVRVDDVRRLALAEAAERHFELARMDSKFGAKLVFLRPGFR